MTTPTTSPTANSPQPNSLYNRPRPTNPKPHSDWTTKRVPLAGTEGGGDDRGEDETRGYQVGIIRGGCCGGQAGPPVSTALPVPTEIGRLVAHADESGA